MVVEVDDQYAVFDTFGTLCKSENLRFRSFCSTIDYV